MFSFDEADLIALEEEDFSVINTALQTVILDQNGNFSKYAGFKPLFAIKTTNAGKTYQDVYTGIFVDGTTTNGKAIVNEINEQASPVYLRGIKNKGKQKTPYEYQGYYGNLFNGIKVYADQAIPDTGASLANTANPSESKIEDDELPF